MPADFRLLMPPDAAVLDDLQAWVSLNPQALSALRAASSIPRRRPDETLARRSIERARNRRHRGGDFTRVHRVRIEGPRVQHGRPPVRRRSPIRPVCWHCSAAWLILLLIACRQRSRRCWSRGPQAGREIRGRLSLGAGRGRLAAMRDRRPAAGGPRCGRWRARRTVSGLQTLLVLRPDSLGRLGAARIIAQSRVHRRHRRTVGLLFSLRRSRSAADRSRRRDAAGRTPRIGRAALPHARRARRAPDRACRSSCWSARRSWSARSSDPAGRSGISIGANAVVPHRAAGRALCHAETFNEFGGACRAELAAVSGVTGVGSVSHLPYDNLPNWAGGHFQTGRR